MHKPTNDAAAANAAAAGKPDNRRHFVISMPVPADIHAVMSTRVERIKVVAAVHFVCISLALMGSFLPSGYFFYNLLLLLVLLWSVHCRDSIDAIHTSLVIEVAAVLFDLICIIGWFHSFNNVLSIVFSIVNLAARPFALIVLHRELSDRGGTISFGSVYPAGDQQRQPTAYEDIDRVPNQSVPSNMA